VEKLCQVAISDPGSDFLVAIRIGKITIRTPTGTWHLIIDPLFGFFLGLDISNNGIIGGIAIVPIVPSFKKHED
jgi:hypothetical protein